MASTYVNNLRLNEMATGDASGSWGTVTNTNLEIIGQATAWGTRAIANASTDNITIADGALDADRCLGLKLTGGGQACTVTLLPNTSSKTWFMYNATSYTLTFTCGSGANVAILAGETKVIATDGLGSGGVVYDLLTAVNLAGTTKTAALTNAGALSNQGTLTVGVDDTGYDVKFFGATSGKSFLWDESADSLIITGTTTLVGTTNLDAVDIDGATQIDATVTVGVDDTGYDVKFFGATSGKSFLWDESADSLIITGTTTLVGTTNLDAVDIDGATQIDATVTVGVDDTGYDVKFFGATAGKYMLWDESADTLEVSGTVVAGAGTALLPSITTTGDLNTGMWFPAADTIAFSEGGVEALRIDSSGNVGIGETTPSSFGKLTVTDSSAAGGVNAWIRNTSDASGDNVKYAGIQFSVGSDDGSTAIRSYRTNSATDYSSALAFLTKGAGAGATTPTERMRIDALGNLLWANTSGVSSSQLGIVFNNATLPYIQVSGGADTAFRYRMEFINGNGTVGTITTNGSATAYNTSSDYRLKENVDYEFDATTRLKQLKPARFNFIASADTTVDGFLAHEVQDIVPEAITGVKDEMQEEEYEVTPAVLDEDGNVITEAVMGTREVPKYQGIDQSKLVPLLTAALQEALNKIASMETRLAALEA